MEYRCWVFILLIGILEFCLATELTFELPDSAKECFYEEIKKNTSCTLEFQVYLFFLPCTQQHNNHINIFFRLSQVASMMQIQYQKIQKAMYFTNKLKCSLIHTLLSHKKLVCTKFVLVMNFPPFHTNLCIWISKSEMNSHCQALVNMSQFSHK